MYDVKCDDCKKVIRSTFDVRDSYAGGRCAECKMRYVAKKVL